MIFVGFIIWGIIWGYATKTVMLNKGYKDDWFWWGFFFGIIAFIVALTKQECRSYYVPDDNSPLSVAAREMTSEKTLKDGGWTCYCGRVNPSYTGTCACGRTKNWNKEQEEKKNIKDDTNHQMQEDSIKFDNLKKLKELYDIGAITEEEYNTKKKQYI